MMQLWSAAELLECPPHVSWFSVERMSDGGIRHAALNRGMEIREGNVTALILNDDVVSGIVSAVEEILMRTARQTIDT